MPLRPVSDEPATTHEVVVNGCLSPESLKLHDPEFYASVQGGLCWTIISSVVMEEWPCLAQLVQESANTGANCNERRGNFSFLGVFTTCGKP